MDVDNQSEISFRSLEKHCRGNQILSVLVHGCRWTQVASGAAGRANAAVFKLGSADQRGSATGFHGVRERIPKSSNCLHGFTVTSVGVRQLCLGRIGVRGQKSLKTAGLTLGFAVHLVLTTLR